MKVSERDVEIPGLVSRCTCIPLGVMAPLAIHLRERKRFPC